MLKFVIMSQIIIYSLLCISGAHVNEIQHEPTLSANENELGIHMILNRRLLFDIRDMLKAKQQKETMRTSSYKIYPSNNLDSDNRSQTFGLLTALRIIDLLLILILYVVNYFTGII